jgi:hypothetical protein
VFESGGGGGVVPFRTCHRYHTDITQIKANRGARLARCFRIVAHIVLDNRFSEEVRTGGELFRSLLAAGLVGAVCCG